MTHRTYLLGAATVARAAKMQPSVAITMDDLNWMPLPNPNETNARPPRCHAKPRRSPRSVCDRTQCRQRDRPSPDPTLETGGHLIGNHTYSHRSYDAQRSKSSRPTPSHADAVLASDLPTPSLFPISGAERGKHRRQARSHARISGRAWLSYRARHYRRGPIGTMTPDCGNGWPRIAAFDVNRFRQPYLDHLGTARSSTTACLSSAGPQRAAYVVDSLESAELLVLG